ETRIKFRLPTPATSKALSKALRGLGPSAPPATKVNLLGVGSTWTPPVLAAWSCLRRQVRTDAGMAASRHAEGSIAGRPSKSNKSCLPPSPWPSPASLFRARTGRLPALRTEEPLDLGGRRFWGVGRMDDGVGQLGGEIAPDGPRLGLQRVGGPHQVPHVPDAVGAFENPEHRRAGGDGLEELGEEGLVRVVPVVFPGHLLRDLAHLQASDLQALGLKAAEDLPHQAPLDRL